MEESYFNSQTKYSHYITKTIMLHHELQPKNKKSTQSLPELYIEK
jgi:hypothetical protein